LRIKVKYLTILPVLLILTAGEIYAQKPDADIILKNVQERFSSIDDYTVDATINVDVDFLRVPEARAKIYFKQPDKIRMKSEGFALIPKQGLNFSPARLLNKNFTAIYVRSDTLDNAPVDVIKAIPTVDSLDIILMTLWVDTAHNVILQIESTTKNSGTVLMELKYNFDKNEILPEEVIFTFNLSNFKLPASFTGEFDRPGEDKIEDTPNKIEGSVSIKYGNYLINTGIPDSVFTEKNRGSGNY
jgi:outer membrane lipoprotein-sorting protein